jgi:hypothetical protein
MIEVLEVELSEILHESPVEVSLRPRDNSFLILIEVFKELHGEELIVKGEDD